MVASPNLTYKREREVNELIFSSKSGRQVPLVGK